MAIKAVGPRCIGYVLLADGQEHLYCIACAVKDCENLYFDRALWAGDLVSSRRCSQCDKELQ